METLLNSQKSDVFVVVLMLHYVALLLHFMINLE